MKVLGLELHDCVKCTLEQGGVVNRPWMGRVETSARLVPLVIAHILLPLLHPSHINQVPVVCVCVHIYYVSVWLVITRTISIALENAVMHAIPSTAILVPH